MTEIVEKRKVTDGVIAFIGSHPKVSANNVPVGDSDAPGVDPESSHVPPPFIEVKRLPDGRDPQGGWGQPHLVEFAKYQILFVGVDRASSEGLADDIKAWFIEQASTQPRVYVNPITVEDHAVIGREVQNDLGYVPSGRANGVLHHYRVQVQKIP